MCKESEEEKRGKFCDLDVFMINNGNEDCR